MNELLFIRVLNMSLTGSFVIWAVLVMRYIMWQGLTLQGIGNGSQLPEDTYLLTFPGGIIPDVSTASVGDMLSLYRVDPEDEAYLTQIPESDRSRLLSSTPILAITENEAGGKMLTVGLNAAVASQLLEGFGFHIRLVLEPDASTTSSVQSPQGKGIRDGQIQL